MASPNTPSKLQRGRGGQILCGLESLEVHLLDLLAVLERLHSSKQLCRTIKVHGASQDSISLQPHGAMQPTAAKHAQQPGQPLTPPP